MNYDNFLIDAAVADTYAAMVRYMETRYYTTASRYTTSAFLRLKLGEALAKRRVAPHIFETGEEAHAFVEIESKTTRKKSKPLEPADSTPIRQVGERDRWAGGPGHSQTPEQAQGFPPLAFLNRLTEEDETKWKTALATPFRPP